MAEVKGDIFEYTSEFSERERALIERAYKTAKKAHGDQKRHSGEPYFNHPYEVALTLAKLGMDASTIAAGLLHDTIEDEQMTEEEMEKEFSKEIFTLVQGVTKLGTLKYRGLKRHVESLRKLFLATAEDIRVLIIRLADRAHNIKTIEYIPKEEKRKRIADETLEIFAPLAGRLGMGALKGELEDHAFPYALPEEYEKTRELLKQKTKADQKYMEKVRRTLQKTLAKEKISVIKTEARLKRLYSLYKKLRHHDMDIDKIYDVVALRVVVPSVADCYRVLGIIHRTWNPLPGRVRDYIAVPKSNGYQSLHTTVFTGDGGTVEIQVRTEAMHREAEYGIASALSYKEGGHKSRRRKQKQKALQKEMSWMQQLLDWQEHVSESREFLDSLQMDFFRDRVFVYTPDGDVIELPEEATPVDFAFAVHTDIGKHMAGAKINGKLASLNTRLQGGDIVEIMTKKDAVPTEKWLAHAKTTLARRRIRAALNEAKNR